MSAPPAVSLGKLNVRLGTKRNLDVDDQLQDQQQIENLMDLKKLFTRIKANANKPAVVEELADLGLEIVTGALDLEQEDASRHSTRRSITEAEAREARAHIHQLKGGRDA
jgi:hypothetical protein